MTDDKVTLTFEQAESMLGEGERIHTFRSAAMCLIGADWDRAMLLDAMRVGPCELGGEACQSMNHGLVVFTDGTPLFVECKKGFDYEAFEQAIRGGVEACKSP